MRFMMIAVLGLMLALSASPAFAFGGGGGHSAAVSSGAAATTGGSSTSVSGNTGTGTVASTSEPLAMFAVGLGLLGVRILLAALAQLRLVGRNRRQFSGLSRAIASGSAMRLGTMASGRRGLGVD